MTTSIRLNLPTSKSHLVPMPVSDLRFLCVCQFHMFPLVLVCVHTPYRHLSGSLLSSVVVWFLPPSLTLFCSDCTLPSAATSISAVTAGTHPASAAMLSYSILPVCACVYICCMCVTVSKCFLTQAPVLSLNF